MPAGCTLLYTATTPCFFGWLVCSPHNGVTVQYSNAKGFAPSVPTATTTDQTWFPCCRLPVDLRLIVLGAASVHQPCLRMRTYTCSHVPMFRTSCVPLLVSPVVPQLQDACTVLGTHRGQGHIQEAVHQQYARECLGIMSERLHQRDEGAHSVKPLGSLWPPRAIHVPCRGLRRVSAAQLSQWTSLAAECSECSSMC